MVWTRPGSRSLTALKFPVSPGRVTENTGMGLKLRDHQVEAVTAIVRGLNIPLHGIQVEGLRGQVHAACGTGKTVIAAA